ncbi:MAG TPA: ribonuclease Z [Frankiaceae bacterium]|nr:ribonuclease Z [Frankiaceae bacterium]
MSVREFVALGTASQVPTRARNHHGSLLRFDAEGILFDPGEGTQRQLLHAGHSAADLTRICITHLHGDHCLGLPGVIQRLGLDAVTRPVDLYFPATGLPYIERLLRASLFHATVEIRLHPVEEPGVVDRWGDLTLEAHRLEHGPETYGWRLVEDDGRRMLPDRLADFGIAGPAVGELQRSGRLQVDGRTIALAEVSVRRPGQRVAFVMDTRLCAGAEALADGADLLVTESTFLSRDEDLATSYGHLTAAHAASLARRGGSRRLVLTHYSQRYPDESAFADEAREVFDDVIAVRDLDRVPVPPRRSLSPSAPSGG